MTFFAHQTPGYEMAELAAELGVIKDKNPEPWQGFMSNITGFIDEGMPNHFVIYVTLEEGVSPEDFIKAVRQEGIFGTSSSDELGIPTPNHHEFRILGDGQVTAIFP